MTIHTGGCHCGKVRFEVAAPEDLELHECNCSVCTMSGFQHLIVAGAAFKLLRGEGDLSCYQFNTGVAKHFFCGNCGIKSFYVPRSNPDGISVNARCLDPSTIRSMKSSPFDGTNWEANAGRLRHLSES